MQLPGVPPVQAAASPIPRSTILGRIAVSCFRYLACSSAAGAATPSLSLSSSIDQLRRVCAPLAVCSAASNTG